MINRLYLIFIALIVLVGFALIALMLQRGATAPDAIDIPPTRAATFEPLLPTPTTPPTSAPTEAIEVVAPTDAPSPIPPTPTTQPTATTEATPTASNTNEFDLSRFGVSGYIEDALPVYELGLRYGVFLDWLFAATPPLPPDVEYWQMVRTSEDGFLHTWDDYLPAVRARPGSVWIIGNEPDVKWQDNVTFDRYAELYHEAYTTIKAADPTARISPAGVAMSTPLRRAYLDNVLSSYAEKYGEPLPADLWTIHAFTLREERDSWGVDIPPGMNADSGELYEIEDHDDLDIFAQNIRDFRVWMATNGYQNMPLAVTEFGILLPNDYGFPPEAIAQYMRDTFDILLSLESEAFGYPADDNRLVQQWFWYIVEDVPDYYPVGNLYNSETNELTLLGEAYVDYVSQFRPIEP